jgi:hypothetical protein
VASTLAPFRCRPTPPSTGSPLTAVTEAEYESPRAIHEEDRRLFAGLVL